jgi:hypothetical protein
MQKIILVSLNGDDNSGGVERVVYYLNVILHETYSVSILKRKGKPGKFDKLIFPLLFSFRLLFIWNCLFRVCEKMASEEYLWKVMF